MGRASAGRSKALVRTLRALRAPHLAQLPDHRHEGVGDALLGDLHGDVERLADHGLVELGLECRLADQRPVQRVEVDDELVGAAAGDGGGGVRRG